MEFLQPIIDANKAAAKAYGLLFALELAGQENTDTYYQVIEKLKGLKERQEAYIYSVDPIELVRNAEKLDEKCGFDKTDQIEDALFEKTSYLAERRTSLQIYYFGLLNHIVDIEYDEDLSEEELKEAEKELEDIYKEFDVGYIREHILTHTLLDYLKIAIAEETNKRVKERLIIAKYNIIYIASCVEDAFLNNPKSFSERVKYIDELRRRGLSDKEAQSYGEYVVALLVGEVNDLETYTDEDLDDQEKQIDAYLKSLYLKAAYSIHVSEYIESVVEEARKEMEKRDKKVYKYINDALSTNLPYRIYENN